MDDWLPALVRKAEGEPLERYVDRLCDLFCNDFLSNPPRIADYSVKLAIGDDIEGRKKCFWHLITEGNGLEADRNYCEERCQRILWIREIILRYGTDSIRYWKETNRGRLRLLLALPDFSYLVVLDVKREQRRLTLITAYPVDCPNRREKLRKKCEAPPEPT